MSWVTLENPKTQKANTLRLTLAIKNGKGKLRLIVPTVLCGKLLLDKPDYVQVMLGTDDNAGKMLVVPGDTPGFKVGRLKHAVVISMPVPPGVTLAENEADVKHADNETPAGFVVDLPVWARPGAYAKPAETGKPGAEAAPDMSIPGGLELKRKELSLGGKTIRLTALQASIAQLLIDFFGKPVPTSYFLKVLTEQSYLDDTDKPEVVVEMNLKQLMERIAESGMGIRIIRHGTGYELRRPVAG